MIRINVKGNRRNATREASRRGITIRKCLKRRRGDTSVFCDVPCSQWNKVARWFGAKTTGTKAGRGYTPGTLLHFSDGGKCK